MNTDIQQLVGMMELQAIGVLVAARKSWKVVKRDGKVLPSAMTMEYVPGMVYLYISNGLVVEVGVA